METGTVSNTQCVTATIALMQAREKLRAHNEDTSAIDEVLRTGVKFGAAKNPHPLLDHLLDALKLKNDAALARLLDVQPPVLSKIRHGVCKFSASMAILAHEETGLSFADMRKLLGMAEGEKFDTRARVR
jgi:hypothetical protein